MSRKLFLAFAVVLAVLFGSLTATATLTTPDAKYRAPNKDGSGNCIFGTAGLPYQQEEGYDVKKVVSSPETIFEARCYYPQQVREYGSHGASFNSIRDEYGRYNVQVAVADAEGNIEWDNVGQLRMSDSSASWDQQRFPMEPGSSHCAGKDDSELGTGGCLDPEKRLRDIARKRGATLPYTGKVCIFVFMNWADMYEERWDGARLIHDPVSIQTTNLASGCVEYTVR
jgi:hypothetical protein